jgi:hypothetical protein
MQEAAAAIPGCFLFGVELDNVKMQYIIFNVDSVKIGE